MHRLIIQSADVEEADLDALIDSAVEHLIGRGPSRLAGPAGRQAGARRG